MRHRTAWILLLAAIGAIASAVTFSLSIGQPPAAPSDPPRNLPPNINSAPPITAEKTGDRTTGAVQPARATTSGLVPVFSAEDRERMTPFVGQAYAAATAGTDWLARMQNPVTGRFINGWVPALNVPLEGDHFLHQAEATLVLARAASFFGDQRHLMRARQAVLSLMAETQVDANDPTVRHTVMPSLVVNRLAAAGLLLACIHELHEPAADLLLQGEQLGNYIRKQQLRDGSLCFSDNPSDAPRRIDAEAEMVYMGMALHGLMRSMRYVPAPWKLEVARRALPACQAEWTAHAGPRCSGWQSAAFGEAFRQTREAPFAAFVFAMNDWICTQQISSERARSPRFVGGFPGFISGSADPGVPQLDCAAAAESLSAACCVCRDLPDVARYERYKLALGSSIGFLATLQFTEDTTRQFAPNFREPLIGGFHRSHQDGNLSTDLHAHAVAAVLACLAQSAER
jgi:hypothetical protein